MPNFTFVQDGVEQRTFLAFGIVQTILKERENE